MLELGDIIGNTCRGGGEELGYHVFNSGHGLRKMKYGIDRDEKGDRRCQIAKSSRAREDQSVDEMGSSRAQRAQTYMDRVKDKGPSLDIVLAKISL
jgi:hypothetical protein